LIEVTWDELKAAEQRSRIRSEDHAGLLAKRFRSTQPAVFAYVPYGPPTPKDISIENSVICAWARRLCVVLQVRYGDARELSQEETSISESKAREHLGNPQNLDRINQMVSIHSAMRMILGAITAQNLTVPDSDRIKHKVLTLLIAFSIAVWMDQQIAGRAVSN
jgi:hypothetical protein